MTKGHALMRQISDSSLPLLDLLIIFFPTMEVCRHRYPVQKSLQYGMDMIHRPSNLIKSKIVLVLGAGRGNRESGKQGLDGSGLHVTACQ